MDLTNMMPLMEISGIIIAVLGAWFSITRFFIPLFRKIKKWSMTWEAFMEDWSGEEARPGRDAIPGVMERLNNIDGQLKNNGGSSIKDAVDRIESNITKINDRLTQGEDQFKQINDRLDKLENTVEEDIESHKDK
jgi:tetrahydromethanopterin S-methyltransferase subunit G